MTTIDLLGEETVLLPERALYLPARGVIVVADIHLGKAGHFRKAGVAVSGDVHAVDLSRLGGLLDKYSPSRLLILGDLFHSRINSEFERFAQWRREQEVSFTLIRGNHDRLPEDVYRDLGLDDVVDSLRLGLVRFVHEPEDAAEGELLVCGHLHSGLQVGGSSRDREVVPCFFLRRRVLTVPAFGAFTGLSRVFLEQGDRCWVVAGEVVFALAK